MVVVIVVWLFNGGFALRRIARRSCCCFLKALRTQPTNHCTQTMFACFSLFVLFVYWSVRLMLGSSAYYGLWLSIVYLMALSIWQVIGKGILIH
jgi:hypothetical protein